MTKTISNNVMKQETHIAIETTYKDGQKAYRFVENTNAQALKYAKELARNFSRKPNVHDTRTFLVNKKNFKDDNNL